MEYKIEIPTFLEDYLISESLREGVSVEIMIASDVIETYKEKKKSLLSFSIYNLTSTFSYSTVLELYRFLENNPDAEKLIKEFLKNQKENNE